MLTRAQRRRLEADGWLIGTVQEFLALSDAEMAIIDMKVSLSIALGKYRAKARFTQIQLARKLRVRKSSVVDMENGAAHATFDLLLQALVASGARPKDIARIIERGGRRRHAA